MSTTEQQQTATPPPRRRRVKKIKNHGGGHHGGSWKVAYADLVTALMALFLVLWLVSQADTKLKQSIANYFRAPGVFTSMRGGILTGAKKVSKAPDAATSKDESQSLFDAAQLLRKQFETRPQFSNYKDQVKIQVTDEGLEINIIDKAEQVSFASGNADLTPATQLVLAEIARTVCTLSNLISIGGHTDRHVFPVGSTYTNWELSADRANAARRELEANCVRSDQISRVVGFADTQLLVPADPFAPANRRINITMMRNAKSDKPDAQSTKNASTDSRLKTDDASASHNTTSHNDSSHDAQTVPENSDVKTPASNNSGDNRTSPNSSSLLGEPDKLPAGVKRIRAKTPETTTGEPLEN